MKLAALALLLSTVANAGTTPLVDGAVVVWNAPDGSQAVVNVTRSNTAPDGAVPVWRTFLAYSFCLVALPTGSCANGYGYIPNSALRGSLTTSYLHPDVLSLQVDTSKVSGYTNQLCYQPDANANCTGGQVSAPGGVFSIQWTKTPQLVDQESTAGFSVDQAIGVIASNSNWIGHSSALVTAVGNTSVGSFGSALGVLIIDPDFYQRKMLLITGSCFQNGLPCYQAGSAAMLKGKLAPRTIKALEGLEEASRTQGRAR